ncbi:hypothetical protein JCM8202_005958 [Rhodotorula sphaerocarpa]
MNAPYDPTQSTGPQGPSWWSESVPAYAMKRSHEETEGGDSKKARMDSPAEGHYPESAHAHSPYHALPAQPAAAAPTALSSTPYAPGNAPSADGVSAAQYQARIPPTGLYQQAISGALASPSLVRVQSTEPFVLPKPNRLAPGEASPSVARPPTGGLRSPSPLPPNSIPAVAQVSAQSALSRNSSPAPAPSQVEDLVALVRASPSISATDGTKEEIERFLRDPHGYSALGNAPLLVTGFWAFELRRLSIDGVEKVDFIIIRSREGSYQLKRAFADKLPVEFARSLSQVTSRARGNTPLVEAAPTLATFSPSSGAVAAPGPTPVAQMTRDQLEAEVERLRQQGKTSDAELSTLRPLAAEVAQLRTDVQALTKQNKSLLGSRESAQADLSYMQAQYQAASQAAVERANESRMAEAETARLKGLLEVGIQQKEAVYRSEIKAVRDMYARLQKEMAFYKAESRRTQDSRVREKAARWDDHLASLQLKADAEARERAGLPAEDSGDDDEEEDGQTSGVTDSQAEPSTLVSSSVDTNRSPPRSQLPAHVSADALGLANLEPDVAQPNYPVCAASSAGASAVAALDAGSAPSAGDGGREEYRCEWRVGPTDTLSETCGEAQGSKTQLQEHVLRFHMEDSGQS